MGIILGRVGLFGLAVIAAAVALISPADAAVAPGDTFTFSIAGFNSAGTTGYILGSGYSASFGTTQTFAAAGYNGQDYTISSYEVVGATTTTDYFKITTPTNFLTTTKVNSTTITALQLDIGTANSGVGVATGADPVNFADVIGSYTAAGNIVYGTGNTVFTLTPTVNLATGGLSFTAAEGVNTGTSAISSIAIHEFDFSITYDNPAAKPTTTTITNAVPLQSTYGQGYSISVATAAVTGTAQPTTGTVTCTLQPQPAGTATTIGPVSIDAGDGTAECAIPATQATGDYSVTATYAGSGDNAFASSTSATAALTITPAPLTITANNANKSYGQGLAGGPGSTAFTQSGLVGAETIGTVTITYGAGAAAAYFVGTYTGQVIPSAATGGTFNPDNYAISYVNGDLSVGKTPLDITANSVTKTVGTTITGTTGSTAFTSNGLVNGETIGSVTIAYGTGSAAGAPVATYTGSVVASAATGGTFTASNYSITYHAGDITVTSAPTPTIGTTGTLAALTTTYGTPSSSGAFNISGANMSAGILVTPPAGWEVSADNSAFGSTVTIGAAGTISSTPVYIRLAKTSAAGTYTGNVVLSSTGAMNVNIATATSTINKAPLTITANDASTVYGGTFPTFTASYATFVNDDGVASLATPPSFVVAATPTSSPGTYAITPTGAVDTNYSFTYVPGTLTISAASTTTTITPPSAITLGQSLTVSVSVAAQPPGGGTPDGTVTVTDGSASCVATLSGGAGSCTITPPAPAGSHGVTASYIPAIHGATANFVASSDNATLTVNSAAAGTVLTSSMNPSQFGQNVSFTTTVTPAAGNPVPTGNVDFVDTATSATLCAGVTLVAGNGNATATCATAELSVGAHPLQANYPGDENTQGASGSLTQTVNAASTSMTLDVTPNPATVDQQVTLTATVAIVAGAAGAQSTRIQGATSRASAGANALAAAPSGTVAFADGANMLGTVNLDGNGVATLHAGPLGAGRHTLTATYSGSGDYVIATATATVDARAADPAVPAPALSAWMLGVLGMLLALAGRQARERDRA